MILRNNRVACWRFVCLYRAYDYKKPPEWVPIRMREVDRIIFAIELANAHARLGEER